MVESSLIIYDNTVLAHSIGLPGQVVFDFETLWRFIKLCNRAYFNVSELHFVHVHPPGVYDLSSLDMNCLTGFKMAIGAGFMFSIVIFDNDDFKDQTYYIKTYRVLPKGIQAIEYDPKNFPPPFWMTTEQILLLKLLSYYVTCAPRQE